MEQMPPKGPQAQPEPANSPEAVAERIMQDLAQLEQMAAEAGVDPKGIAEVSQHFAEVVQALQGGGAEKPMPGGPTQGGPGAVPAM